MKKRIIAAAALTAMTMTTMTTGAPVFAATTSEQEVNSNSTAECVVTVHQNSEFTVTLPKTITLDNIADGIANEDYTVKVKGDIAGDETITVTPVASFNMEEAGGKAPVPVTVTQEKTKFIFSDISGEGATATGHLTSGKLTAGDWTGTMSFTIAKVAPGLYDTNGNKLRALTASDVEGGPATTSSGVDTSKVAKVIIPEGTTRIGNNAFAGWTSLTSVTIPNGVTSIGDYAFAGCSGLTSITIPDSVTSIGTSAFTGCTGLTSVTLSNNATSIGNSAFTGCSSLTSITIPSSVTSIGTGAFNNCTSLTSVTIQSGVRSIGNTAFSSCRGLTSITIPSSVTSIGQQAFGGCTNLSNATFETTSGWHVGDQAGAKTTELSSSDLTNTSTVATYLKANYCGNYWSR